MPRTGSPQLRSAVRGRFPLAASAAWSHRWGALAWVAGTGGFLAYFGIGYETQIRSFEGGAAAFGIAATAVAQAMRPLSGPSDRLDTYGGYVTYHNASLVALLLSLWALIQGAQAIRGWEERGGMELWLATGRRRWIVVRDQWLGFGAALSAIALGVAIGFGAGAAVAEEPNWGGAAIVAAEIALVAGTFFALGVVVTQVTSTARAGAGLATAVMVGLYLLGNLAPELGPFAWVRFFSPFFYFQQSRVLIPGYSVDYVATAVLAATATAPMAVAILAFGRRDIGGRLWPRDEAGSPASTPPCRVRIGTPWQRDAWLADLRSQWLSISLWALASGVFMALIVAVAKQVASVWESSDLIRQLFVRLPGTTFVDQYMGYVTILAALAPVAFVVTEASRWVADLGEGRAEAQLSVFGSRSRLVLEWALSAVAGIIVVSLAVLAGCLIGAASAGVELRADSLVRTTAAATLLGSGICGIALLAVVVFRSGFAVGALAAALGIGFFVSVLAPLFRWPDWVVRLSPFDAFGTPYAAVPRPSGIALLAALAVIGAAGAALVARRRSSLS